MFSSPMCVVQLLSHVRLFAAPWTEACQAPLSFTISQSLLKCMSMELGDAIQPSRLLSSPSPALNLSQHQSLSQRVGSSHQVARVLAFQLQHQSFRMDWFDLLAIHGTLKGLLQHQSQASLLYL